MREKWCEYCQKPEKCRQQGELLYCINCGSCLGPARSDVAIQFL